MRTGYSTSTRTLSRSPPCVPRSTRSRHHQSWPVPWREFPPWRRCQPDKSSSSLRVPVSRTLQMYLEGVGEGNPVRAEEPEKRRPFIAEIAEGQRAAKDDAGGSASCGRRHDRAGAPETQVPVAQCLRFRDSRPIAPRVARPTGGDPQRSSLPCDLCDRLFSAFSASSALS